MDASLHGLLFLAFVMASPSESSGKVKSLCKNDDLESYLVLEGEAFYFVPYIFDYIERPPHEEVTWYKNTSKVENVSADDSDRIHYHGAELFLLDLVPEDSGLYTARYEGPSGGCRNARLNLTVVKTSFKNNSRIFYGAMKTTNTNPRVQCQNVIEKICKKFKGNFTWYKDFALIPGEHKNDLRLMDATQHGSGVYTCVCSWTHKNRTHSTSGSKLLTVKKPGSHRKPKVLSPTNNELFCDEGSELKLNCSVFCGTGLNQVDCFVRWLINKKPINNTDGYNETTTFVTEDGSKNTISTAILTIHKVSAEDFHSEFKCQGLGKFWNASAVSLSLKRRESIIPLLIGKLCVLCFCVFAVVLVKCFIVDLTLFFRAYVPVSSYKKDLRAYDAYVVYQTQNLDKATEDTLCRFVMDALPSVLEEKCGYRLFIHGRDDTPGEDLMELVEERMKESRRLIIILMLGSASQPRVNASLQNPMGGFDWQVGLHHALMQTGVKVILIQFGQTGPQGYANLPLSLQHLIRKSPPVKWPEGSQNAAALNSRFWKRVRYLMPAVPVRKCAQLPAAYSLRILQMDEK